MADSLLDNYNPLYDIHLRQYFALPHMQKHLQKMGLLESTLNLNGDEVYARHHAMMDMMLKNREAQLLKIAELRKKLDAAEKVEICRRIRTGQSPESYRRGKPSRSLSRSRANQKGGMGGGRQRRFSNSYEDRDFVQHIEEKNVDPDDYDTRDPYKRLSANAKRFNYLHKLDDKTLVAYKDNLKLQLQRLERFREISFGPHSVARQPPPLQTSWFFRRRSALNIRGRKTTTGNKLNASYDSRTSCPPAARKRKDSNTRLPPINPQKARVPVKQPVMSLQQTTTRLPPATKKPAPTRGRPSNKRQTTTTTMTTITTDSKSPHSITSLPPLPSITGHGIFTGAAAAANVGSALFSDKQKNSPTLPTSPIHQAQESVENESLVGTIDQEHVDEQQTIEDHNETEVVTYNAPPDNLHGNYEDTDSEPEYAEEDDITQEEILAHHKLDQQANEPMAEQIEITQSMMGQDHSSSNLEEVHSENRFSPVHAEDDFTQSKVASQSPVHKVNSWEHKEREASQSPEQSTQHYQHQTIESHTSESFEHYSPAPQSPVVAVSNSPDLYVQVTAGSQSSAHQSPVDAEVVAEPIHVTTEHFSPPPESPVTSEGHSLPSQSPVAVDSHSPAPQSPDIAASHSPAPESPIAADIHSPAHSPAAAVSQHSAPQSPVAAENDYSASQSPVAAESYSQAPKSPVVAESHSPAPQSPDIVVSHSSAPQSPAAAENDYSAPQSPVAVENKSSAPQSPGIAVSYSPAPQSPVAAESHSPAHSPAAPQSEYSAPQSPIAVGIHSPVAQSPVGAESDSYAPQSPVIVESHSPPLQSPVAAESHSPAQHSPVTTKTHSEEAHNAFAPEGNFSPTQHPMAAQNQYSAPESPVANKSHSPAPKSPVTSESHYEVTHSSFAPEGQYSAPQSPNAVQSSYTASQNPFAANGHSPASQSPVDAERKSTESQNQFASESHISPSQSPVSAQSQNSAPQSPVAAVSHSPAPESPNAVQSHYTASQSPFATNGHNTAPQSPDNDERHSTAPQSPVAAEDHFLPSLSPVAYDSHSPVPQSPVAAENYSPEPQNPFVSEDHSPAPQSPAAVGTHSPRSVNSNNASENGNQEEESFVVQHHSALSMGVDNHINSEDYNVSAAHNPTVNYPHEEFEERQSPIDAPTFQEQGVAIADRIDLEAYHNSPTKETTSPVIVNPIQVHVVAEQVAEQLSSLSNNDIITEPANQDSSLTSEAINEIPVIIDMVNNYEEPSHSPEAYELNYKQESAPTNVDPMTTSFYQPSSEHGGSDTFIETGPENTTGYNLYDDGSEHNEESLTHSVYIEKGNSNNDSASPVADNLIYSNGARDANISTDSLVIHDDHDKSDYQMTQSIYQPSDETSEQEWDDGNKHVHEVIREHTDEFGNSRTETITSTTTTVIKSGVDKRNNNADAEREHSERHEERTILEENDEHGSNGNLFRETIVTTTHTTGGLPEGGILVDDGDETNISSL
uniref:Uncharacterized protein n=1 Tax=Caenorhabditis japonica TaxID=281687 RepID=A0A8R1HUP8_CAEJA